MIYDAIMMTSIDSPLLLDTEYYMYIQFGQQLDSFGHILLSILSYIYTTTLARKTKTLPSFSGSVLSVYTNPFSEQS